MSVTTRSVGRNLVVISLTWIWECHVAKGRWLVEDEEMGGVERKEMYGVEW